MCQGSDRDVPFSVNGVPFVVDRCRAHLHAFGGIVMPSGGVVTMFAQAGARDVLVRKIAALLADVLKLYALEEANPGVPPVALFQAGIGKVTRA